MAEDSDRHIYLYAKNWYAKVNYGHDLRILFSKRNGVDEKYISIKDIRRMLLDITYPYITNLDKFYNFIDDLDPDNYWKHGTLANTGKVYTSAGFNRVVISKCLSVLGLLNVTDIPFDLGSPDSTVLPLRPKE